MLSIIAAIGKNRELGVNGDLIWHLPNDLKFFKNVTMGYPVVMGRKTYESIGRLLPGRENIILTSSDLNIKGATIFHSIDEILEYLENKDAFIIGGSSLYKAFLPYCNKLYLTLINDVYDADVYFPEFNENEYTKDIIDENSDGDITYSHVLYRRKNER